MSNQINTIPGSSQYLTTGEIARDLGVSLRIVMQWIDAGKMVGIRYPQMGHAPAHRRVLRTEYDRFRRDTGFTSRISENLVLLISCGDQSGSVDGFDTICTGSVFDAGYLVRMRMPRCVVANWDLGRLELGEIAAGCRSIVDYTPVMIAFRPNGLVGITSDDLVGCGFSYVTDRIDGACLRSFILQAGSVV